MCSTITLAHPPPSRRNEVPLNATLKIRHDHLAEHRKRANLTGEQDLADAMGANRGTVNKVLNGKAKPGPDFIASLVGALNCPDFTDLFEIVAKETA